MTSADHHAPEPLSEDDVRKVARLSPLLLEDDQIAEHAQGLRAVLGYVERLQNLDLEGVEPLTTPAGETNRLDEDDPADPLDNAVLMSMTPKSVPPFVATPKVAGDGGA